MKKILIVTSFYPPYYIGGADTHVYHLANALAKRGHRITVLSSYDSYFLKKKEAPKPGYPNHKNVDVIFIKSKIKTLSPILNYIFGYPVFDAEIKKIFQRSYDVIHYHNISLFGPGILKYGKAKKIFTVHDHWFICQMNGLFVGCRKCKVQNNITMDFKRFKNQMFHCLPHAFFERRPIQIWRFSNALEKNLRNIDCFITPSNYMKNIMSQAGLSNIEVIPNFISGSSKKASKERRYFLFVGRLERNKGIIELIDVFKDAKEELHVVGSGELEKEIQKKKTKNVKMLGWKSHDAILDEYSGAKATIIPSVSPENFPTVALESMAAGIPVIGSKMGGIPEIVVKIDRNLVFSDFRELNKILENFNHKKYPQWRIRKIAESFSEKRYMERYEGLI